MTWNQALPLITANITVGLHLDRTVTYKKVSGISAQGYKIQVGLNSHVFVSFGMLSQIHAASLLNANTYENKVFASLFPKLLHNKPCYVHTVGKLFERALVATPTNSRQYFML